MYMYKQNTKKRRCKRKYKDNAIHVHHKLNQKSRHKHRIIHEIKLFQEKW